ncbi:low temperature requirement protein A [Phytohabitans rumicis]|uniref:Low temperature requirement protein LtrA n=1 Tax=Phytohabitans rumicis TaxID=1076125 RepID=A0A6V8LSV2_9ACTN|nr:low temperature requirement protein A [Phytohabitans rumicis]GFJ95825.1 low temperature requirement protein LtrA [Phytohabitans rumicis]
MTGGKRVSWVELYFDLIFVFAVAQVAHAIVAEPQWGRVAAALGLFATLWWTWIGYAVLYNRQADDRQPLHRLFVLAGTVPCGIAATQAHQVFEKHPAGFALALAGARVVLSVAYLLGARGAPLARRAGMGFAASAVIFAVSAAVPAPRCYPLWALALLQEVAALLLGERRRAERGLSRADRLRAMFAPPKDAATAVDAAHLSERFGLFMIILLGELVITVGAAALDRPQQDSAYWLSMGGGLVLAGALWWVYFDTVAGVNERLLSMSGGNPALAYSLYAAGHFTPAFALLLVVAGVNLSLHEEPPGMASWFVAVGLTVYFGGARVFSSLPRRWWARPLRLAAIAATVNLGWLNQVLSAPGVVVVATVWTIGAAVAVSLLRRNMLRRLGEDPVAFFRDTD